MERAELEERRLTCVECGAASDGRAEGWRALLAGGVVDGVDVGELGRLGASSASPARHDLDRVDEVFSQDEDRRTLERRRGEGLCFRPGRSRSS